MARIEALQQTLNLCKEINTDLVEMSSHGSCCAECAKYEGRVFSISGEDARFPKLPEQVFSLGGIHEGCSHTFHPFYYYPGAQHSTYIVSPDGSGYTIQYSDVIEFSNRPFVDSRTPQQKQEYEQRLKAIEQRKMMEESRKRYLENKAEYNRLKSIDPASVPKSFSKYLKQLNTNK